MYHQQLEYKIKPYIDESVNLVEVDFEKNRYNPFFLYKIAKIIEKIKKKLNLFQPINKVYVCETDVRMKQFCQDEFFKKFRCINFTEFDKYWNKYINLKPFKINENIFDVLEQQYILAINAYDERVHFIVRCATQFRLIQVFDAMKVDMDDPNVRVVPEE